MDEEEDDDDNESENENNSQPPSLHEIRPQLPSLREKPQQQSTSTLPPAEEHE